MKVRKPNSTNDLRSSNHASEIAKSASGDWPVGRWRIAVSIGLIVSGIIACISATMLIGIDLSISKHVRDFPLPGDLRKAVLLSEAFAHGMGVTTILIAIFLASGFRRSVWIPVAMTATSGILANLIKALFTRSRPYTYDESRVSVLEPHDWEFLGQGSYWDASIRSFPSGHTATAWGLAIGLSIIYPRAAPVFVFLALAASFQRMYSGAHFLSDVLAGFAIACCCCGCILLTRWARSLLAAPNPPSAIVTFSPHTENRV